MNKYNEAILKVPMPARIKSLPVNDKGFPVPWFVVWMKDGLPVPPGEGVADFRCIDTPKVALAIKQHLCWVCGQKLGKHLAFTIGPMCSVTRVTAEPPEHLECAVFAAQACPFLVNPRMRRNEKDLPELRVEPAGEHIKRNPGAVCIWVTKSFKPFRVDPDPLKPGQRDSLLNLGPAERLLWYTEGRKATFPEIIKAVESGYPILRESAKRGGTKEITYLENLIDHAQVLIETQWFMDQKKAKRDVIEKDGARL